MGIDVLTIALCSTWSIASQVAVYLKKNTHCGPCCKQIGSIGSTQIVEGSGLQDTDVIRCTWVF